MDAKRKSVLWVVETRLQARLIFIKPKCIVETRLSARLFRRSLFEVGRIGAA